MSLGRANASLLEHGYAFRRLTTDDLDLVNGWIAEPHVAQWRVDADGPAEPVTPEDFDEPDFRMWLVLLDGEPFAYMQDYDPHLYPGHHFEDRPAPARGIDQFIGRADMLGQGHGSAFIRQRVAELFDEGAVVVVTDPDPSNARAIRAYEKAGFVPYGEGNHPQWGRSLLMARAADTTEPKKGLSTDKSR